MVRLDPKDLVLIGHVSRPHGLTGLLRTVSYSRSRETFLEAGSVFLSKKKEEFYEKSVLSIRPHGKLFLLRLSELESPEQAEFFRGARIYVRKDCLKSQHDDEYFWHEILGMHVYLVTGEYLGTIMEIFFTGSNDVYVIKGSEKDYLIPATHQVVANVDVAKKRMTVIPIKGLLDL